MNGRTGGRSARWAVALATLVLLIPAGGAAAAPYAGARGTAGSGGETALQASVASFLARKREVAGSLASRKALPDRKVLAIQPRQQTTDYNCGPAVAQLIINYTRGRSSTTLDGGDAEANWITQSTLARWMGTSVLYGTAAPGVARALNREGGLRKPFEAWTYVIERTGGPKSFHDKVVTDIAVYDMPVAMAVNPHMARVGIYKLASWPDERPLARHWIAVRGYDGLWGSGAPLIHYTDSSAGYGGGTGNYWDLSVVLHEVNARNRGRIIW